MALSLHILPRSRLPTLMKASPRGLSSEVLGTNCRADLTVADAAWTDRAIDLRVGGLLALPSGTTVEGEVLGEFLVRGGTLVVEAIRPGSGRVVFPDGEAAFVRIARRLYQGRSRFRFLPDPESED